MKDKLIEQKLNEYAEAVKPEKKILEPALSELRKKHRQGGETDSVPQARKPIRASFLAGLSAAAVFILLFVYFIANLMPGAPGPSGAPGMQETPGAHSNYTLSDLTYTVSDINSIKNSVLIINKESTYINIREYFTENSNEPVVISALYKTVGDGGLDEIVVIADISGGLTDYNNFKTYSKVTISGVEVRQKQILENGEYYTDAYFKYRGVDYYIRIASPLADTLQYYMELLLEE